MSYEGSVLHPHHKLERRGARLRRVFVVIACLGSVACASPRDPSPITRGQDPWVVRATLDGQPRTLILALSKDLWVAYDAQRASLFRVTTRAINFDGAVYNTHHGPQPATQGSPVLTSAFPEPWHVHDRGHDLRPTVQYRGHSIEAGHVTLHYTLTLADGRRLDIDERPEVLRLGTAAAQLERVFTVSGASADLTVSMDFNAPELQTSDGVEVLRRDHGLVGIVGKLTLDTQAATRLVMSFAPDGATAAPSDGPNKAAAAQPPGQRLIADADCAACHNPTLRTVGPSYTQIAERYRTNTDTIAGLAAKIRQGGADEWGDVAMTSHPTLEPDDARTIAEYILTTYDPKDAHGDKTSHRLSSFFRTTPGFDERALQPGVAVEIFETGHPLHVFPKLDPGLRPNAAFSARGLVFDETRAENSFQRPDASTGMIMRARGFLNITNAGDYDLRIEHAGSVELTIDERSLIKQGDTNTVSPWASVTFEPGLHSFELLYASSTDAPRVAVYWQPPGSTDTTRAIPLDNLRMQPPADQTVSRGSKPYHLQPGSPGAGSPLDRVHPSFALSAARPHHFKPMVGGIDFLPNGHMLVSTWDALGAVYELENLEQADPERIVVHRIAEGLAEPLGLKVVDGEIFVLQKHELTKLRDRDHDGVMDDYQTVSNGWGVTGNFHEFAFGLAYRDDAFYATLATAIEPGGAAVKNQNHDRGKVLKIDRSSGAIDFMARGLRTPNGINFGVDGELFVTDNEGDWLPANKLVHVRPDAFFGSYSVDREHVKDLPITAPVVWLPVHELANSPSQPMALNIGPYRNQMIYGDVTYGGLTRVVMHKADGQYQGCALPFTQGLEAGINRVASGPDGSIYVGGIGNPADWQQQGKFWYGLQRLTYTGATTFEMLDLEVQAEGIEITFTEPLRVGDGDSPADYRLEQWRYVSTAAYGGPKIDPEVLPVQGVQLSADRRKVFLFSDRLAAGHVVHVLLESAPVAASNHELWSSDAYCTINTLPQTATPRPAPIASPAVNTLSDAERAAGVRLLFDGKTLQGWQGVDKTSVATSWQVQDGTLKTMGSSGTDLLTRERYADFELDLEWQVAPGANSGVFYRARDGEDAPHESWRAGAELQLLDDAAHPDGQVPSHRAGSVYDLYPPQAAITRAPGMFNHARIVAHGTHVEHWLNGHKVVDYDTSSASFKQQVARSKFADLPAFGASPAGRIGLQHHGSAVAFRNIKLRPLAP